MGSFFVPGKPQQKGSTKSFRHPRTGAVITTAANQNSKAWEQRIAIAASHHNKSAPTQAAVEVCAEFIFARPKSHYGTGKNADVLKSFAPMDHVTTPDVDKLLRCVLDGLTQVMFVDDRQVARCSAFKRYAEEGEKPGARIEVTPRREE